MSSRLLLALSAVLLVGAGFMFFQSTSVTKRGIHIGTREAAACSERDCRPSFHATTLDGKPVDEAMLAGKVVLVNFWAPWCRPCVGEMPALEAAWRRHEAEGLVIVGVVVDADRDVSKFLQRHGITYPIVHSDDTIDSSFGSPDGLPTSFLYDRTGHRRAKWDGAVDDQELERALAPLFAR